MRKLKLDLVSEATWSESIIQLMLLVQSIGPVGIATLDVHRTLSLYCMEMRAIELHEEL